MTNYEARAVRGKARLVIAGSTTPARHSQTGRYLDAGGERLTGDPKADAEAMARRQRQAEHIAASIDGKQRRHGKIS